MASSGSSGRPNSGSKGFDFAADDILCSYEDFAQDSSNGNHSDPAIGVGSSKDFHKSRMGRPSAYPATSYSPQEDSFAQDVISTVESTMKKYADNLMRFLEGISSRMSQLELYCYNLDKSIGEMRSELVRDHGEADIKLRSLEKHLQEVQRSVQILRDKQELADTQKELAKLHLVQKESSSTSHSQPNEERATFPSDPKKTDDTSDMNDQQLALALPHQVAPQPSIPTRSVEQHQPMATHSQAPPQNMAPQQSYYLHPSPLPNPPSQAQHPQNQYMPPDPRYQTQSVQDISRVSRVSPQPPQSQVSQAPPAVHSLPQYQQQWPPQMPQQPSVQPQIRPPQSTTVYPSYPNQPANPSPPETLPSSMPMQVPFSGIPQSGASRAEAMPYGYGGGRAAPTLSAGNAYMIYDAEGTRGSHHPQQSPFPQGAYPPTSANIMVKNPSPPQFLRNNPYSELIEKLVSMGYRGDHVVDVIQRMEESGQPVDFNSVLDRLNGHSSSGSSQRGGW